MNKKLLFGILVLISISSFAGDQTPICDEMAKSRSAWSMFFTNAQIAFFPGTFYHLKTTQFEISKNNVYQRIENGKEIKRNLVVSMYNPNLSVPEFEKDKSEFFAEQEKIWSASLMRLKQESKRRCLVPDLKNHVLGRCSKFETKEMITNRCRAVEREMNLDYKALEEMLTVGLEIRNVKDQKRSLEYQRKIFMKQKSSFDREWDFIGNVTANMLEQILRSSDVENVIIIGHSAPTDEIVDANGTIISTRFFFKNISPTIRSISLFTCDSNKVAKKYDLKNRLSLGASVYQKRAVFTFEDKDYLGQGNKTSPAALKLFLRKVDASISKLENDDINESITILPEAEMCYLDISELESSLMKGKIHLVLNLNFIGEVNSESKKVGKMEFDCRILNEDIDGKRALLLRPLGSEIEASTNFSIDIIDSVNQKVIAPEKIKHNKVNKKYTGQSIIYYSANK